MHNAAQDSTLHVHLLGDFRLTYGDEAVTSIDTPRLQSLLAYLLLHRDAPQSRHRLAFLFWPDSTESQAFTNLRNLLYHLCHSLPDPDRFLYIDRRTLRWRTEARFTLDVADFEDSLDRAEQLEHVGDQTGAQQALEEAVGLYRGDLLLSSYEDWISPERQRLRQAFDKALERLIQLLEDQREYRAAIGYLRRSLRHDPLHEASYRRLMRLHALTGDRPGALRTYHKCATTLERELDVEPSPATREIYEQLLQMDGTPGPPSTGPKPTVAASSLVGRHKAWRELREAWKTASGGRPHVALISGEAGIGKTRLAEELVRWADRQGIANATARCYAAEGELAYAPVAAWLRALTLPRLDRVWLSEMARILPELLAEQPDLSPPGPLTEPWQRRRFFEALARAVLGGDQPLLLLIDALQWCDRGTLEWLHYLLRFDPRARLLVVGTCRPEELGDDHPLTALLHTLRHDGQLTEIKLAPLSSAETKTLALNVIGRELEPDMTDCLCRETEGNPLFVVEMARVGPSVLSDEQEATEWVPACLPRPLPPRVRTAIAERLAQLSPEARDLAEIAATIGREFTFEVLLQASDVDEGRLVRGLDELWRRRIVREQGEAAYDFSHDKLREVTYARLSEARRRLLHRRVAQTLEAVHTDDLDSVAARVAVHYEQADQVEKAAQYYRQAADVAQQMQAQEEAARYRQRASALLKETTASEP